MFFFVFVCVFSLFASSLTFAIALGYLPAHSQDPIDVLSQPYELQWNLSVTTTSMIKFIICGLFSNVF